MRAHNFGLYGRTSPAGTAFSTAVPCILLIRMRPEVQVLPGPPAMTSTDAGHRVRSSLDWPGTGSRTLTWLPFLVMRPVGHSRRTGSQPPRQRDRRRVPGPGRPPTAGLHLRVGHLGVRVRGRQAARTRPARPEGASPVTSMRRSRCPEKATECWPGSGCHGLLPWFRLTYAEVLRRRDSDNDRRRAIHLLDQVRQGATAIQVPAQADELPADTVSEAAKVRETG
jgi:hypothetical protein